MGGCGGAKKKLPSKYAREDREVLKNNLTWSLFAPQDWKEGSLMGKMRQVFMEGKEIFVGLEDSKKTWRVNVRYNRMEVHQASMPAEYEQLKRYFENRFPACVITVMYEAGFKGFNLYDQLVADGIGCVVTPPNKVTQAKDNRVKTDKRDARRLARNLENGDYVACHVPDREQREDRDISRSYEQMKKDICREKNRIRGFLKFHGYEGCRSRGSWSNRKYLELTEADLPGSLKVSINLKIEYLAFLFAMQKTLKDELKRLSGKERYRVSVAAKQSFPGVGWLTAIRLTLEWGDMSRFESGKHIASFTGLTSCEYSTGDTVRRGRITGQSAGQVRRWLVECSWRAIRKDPVLYNKFQRVWSNSGSKKKAIIAVARKLAVRMRAVEINGDTYEIGKVA